MSEHTPRKHCIHKSQLWKSNSTYEKTLLSIVNLYTTKGLHFKLTVYPNIYGATLNEDYEIQNLNNFKAELFLTI